MLLKPDLNGGGDKSFRFLLFLTSDNATVSSGALCCRSKSLCSPIMTNKYPKAEASWPCRSPIMGKADQRGQTTCRRVTWGSNLWVREMLWAMSVARLGGRCSLSRWAVMGQVLWWGRSHPSAGACRWANTKSDRRSCGMQLPPLWSILKYEQMGQSVSCPFLGTTDMGLEHPDSCFPVIQRTFLRWMGGSSPSEKKSSLLPKMYYSGCLWAKQWGPCPMRRLATGPPWVVCCVSIVRKRKCRKPRAKLLLRGEQSKPTRSSFQMVQDERRTRNPPPRPPVSSWWTVLCATILCWPVAPRTSCG